MEQIIYAIVSEKRGPGKLAACLDGMKGFAGADLFAVNVDEISTVVSEIERADLITDKANAIAFAGVIASLAEHFTLLPMRFGSMLDSPDAIRKMLERNYPEFQNNLQQVENKNEFGLKVICDSEKLMTELLAKSEEVSHTSQQPITGNKDSVFREYVNRKLKAHRREEMLLNYVDKIIAEFTGLLIQNNAVKKVKKMTSTSTLIDAVFLLEKDKKDELVMAIKDMQIKYPGLNFILTGPWPPYNFVDVTLK